jgi:hypothetical protein
MEMASAEGKKWKECQIWSGPLDGGNDFRFLVDIQHSLRTLNRISLEDVSDVDNLML